MKLTTSLRSDILRKKRRICRWWRFAGLIEDDLNLTLTLSPGAEELLRAERFLSSNVETDLLEPIEEVGDMPVTISENVRRFSIDSNVHKAAIRSFVSRLVFGSLTAAIAVTAVLGMN